MTVLRSDAGVVLLEGACAVEDAEPLLQLLQGSPLPVIDWTECSHLHTAVVQVVLASGIRPIGPCGDAWVRQWTEPELPRRETVG
jgi:hypothetical protein